MKTSLYALPLFISFLLVSCSNGHEHPSAAYTALQTKSTTNGISVGTGIQKIVTLSHDVEIAVGRKEDYGTFETYTLFTLSHHNKQLYVDSSLTEYEFGDTMYPMVRQLQPELLEVFVEVNNRPSKNYVTCFTINKGSVVSMQRLPSFIAQPANLDADPLTEVAGYSDWGESYGDNGALTSYNPILYYELRPTGIVLDSVLTIATNTAIYGAFYGFTYNEKVSVKTAAQHNWNEAVDRISKGK